MAWRRTSRRNEIDSSELESAVAQQGASGLLDGGVSVDQVDENEGDRIVAQYLRRQQQQCRRLGVGRHRLAGGGDLIKKLLPILAPIVLAYIGKQFSQRSAAPAVRGTQAQAAPSGGGLGDVLGSILGGAGGGGGNNPLGSILGSVLGGGGGQSNPIGEILGGLLGGKR